MCANSVSGSSKTKSVGTGKMVNAPREGQSQERTWWSSDTGRANRSLYFFHGSERQIEPSGCWFLQRFLRIVGA